MTALKPAELIAPFEPPTHWRALIAWCLGRAERLTLAETQFLRIQAVQPRLTPRRADALVEIAARLRAG
ncbi:MAG TPA: hypothetical protein VLI93_00075 [Acetobacteraceae bacterium]|nr:hypothetical protein [Acetobacteraceae bacterium]